MSNNANKPSLTPYGKFKNAMRIDRAVRFVWQAGPGWTLASLGLIVVQGVLPLISLYLIKLIIDTVSGLVTAGTGGQGFSRVAVYIGLAGGAALLTALATSLSRYIKTGQTQAVTDYMYAVLHKKSIAVDLAYYESPKYRDTLHRAQQEGPYRPTRIVEGLVATGQNGASLVALAGLLLFLNPFLPLFMVIAVVPGVIFRFKYSDQVFAWQNKRTEDERMAGYLNWMLTGDAHAREFRLFGLGAHFAERFKKLRQTLRTEKLGFEKKRSRGAFMAQASTTLAVFGSFVYIAARTVAGDITMGDMVMYFQAFQRGQAFLAALMEGVAGLYEDNLFLLNFYEFLDVKPSVKDPGVPEPVPGTMKSGLVVENLSFGYEDCAKGILKGLNFEIKPGEVVALVGRNGSGKSTLVKLLCRLYDPVQGAICLDGKDIRAFSVEAYRKKISVVFQDYIRYNLTAGENIWLGNIEGDQTSPGIEAAARKAGIHSLITGLDQQYNTPLGRVFKGGQALSVGQWQMMALGRAFFRDADIVILDEPASALDVNTEYEVFKKFKSLVTNKAALIISHRLSTVRMADRILLLKDGTIAENGSHGELMALDGSYAALFRKQAQGYT